jgi:hypothetical protein
MLCRNGRCVSHARNAYCGREIICDKLVYHFAKMKCNFYSSVLWDSITRSVKLVFGRGSLRISVEILVIPNEGFRGFTQSL